MIYAEEYKRLMHEVDVVLSDIIDELQKATAILGNDQRFVRTRLLLCFSFLEVMAGVYNAYHGLGLTNTALLTRWLSDLCITDRNGTYRNHPFFNRMDSQMLLTLRNSVIHAFALPQPEEGRSIVVVNGAEDGDWVRKVDAGFIAKGWRLTFLSPDSLLALFLDAGFTQISDMLVATEVADERHIKSLTSVASEFSRRGAKTILIDESRLKH